MRRPNLLIVYAVILISNAVINHFGVRLVAWLNDFSVTVHIIGVIVIVGALFLFAPKQPRPFVPMFNSSAPRSRPVRARSNWF
jgi:amino acid transporter